MSEAKKKMTEEEILKSLDAIIDETLGTDEVAKSGEESKNENKQANGGKDELKSGTPMSEEQKAEEAKKAKEADEDKKKKEKEEAEKSAKSEADLKKSDDKDADDKKNAKEKDDDKDDKKKMPFGKKMKKSIEELSEILDEDELELVKAWRAENAEPEQEETASEIAKSVAQAVGAQLDDMKKSFDQKLADKDAMIKSLTDEVKKISTQPAHGRQSIDTLETIEKGGSSETTLSKAQVLDTMLDMQKAGKGITSRHVAEFEATRNLSNPSVKALVMEEAKKRFSN